MQMSSARMQEPHQLLLLFKNATTSFSQIRQLRPTRVASSSPDLMSRYTVIEETRITSATSPTLKSRSFGGIDALSLVPSRPAAAGAVDSFRRIFVTLGSGEPARRFTLCNHMTVGGARCEDQQVAHVQRVVG